MIHIALRRNNTKNSARNHIGRSFNHLYLSNILLQSAILSLLKIYWRLLRRICLEYMISIITRVVLMIKTIKTRKLMMMMKLMIIYLVGLYQSLRVIRLKISLLLYNFDLIVSYKCIIFCRKNYSHRG